MDQFNYFKRVNPEQAVNPFSNLEKVSRELSRQRKKLKNCEPEKKREIAVKILKLQYQYKILKQKIKDKKKSTQSAKTNPALKTKKASKADNFQPTQHHPLIDFR